MGTGPHSTVLGAAGGGRPQANAVSKMALSEGLGDYTSHYWGGVDAGHQMGEDYMEDVVVVLVAVVDLIRVEEEVGVEQALARPAVEEEAEVAGEVREDTLVQFCSESDAVDPSSWK